MAALCLSTEQRKTHTHKQQQTNLLCSMSGRLFLVKQIIEKKKKKKKKQEIKVQRQQGEAIKGRSQSGFHPHSLELRIIQGYGYQCIPPQDNSIVSEPLHKSVVWDLCTEMAIPHTKDQLYTCIVWVRDRASMSSLAASMTVLHVCFSRLSGCLLVSKKKKKMFCLAQNVIFPTISGRQKSSGCRGADTGPID